MKRIEKMELTLQTEAPPLRRDTSGALRVGNSRVLLELIIDAFDDGATPETIVQQYTTVSLADVYGVLAYYLRHRQEVDAYRAERERLAEKVRARIEARQDDLGEIRDRLLARKQAASF